MTQNSDDLYRNSFSHFDDFLCWRPFVKMKFVQYL